MRLPDPSSLPRPWLASYPPGVPPTYAYPEVPLTRFLDDAARDLPDATAIWFEGATMDYGDLLDRVDRFATALGDLGVGRGDRVAVGLSNVPGAVVALFAVLRIGAIVVPLDPRASDSSTFDRLHSSGAEVAVVDAAAVPGLTQLRARLRHLRHVVSTSVADWLPFPHNRVGRLRERFRRAGQADGEVRSMAALIDASDPIAKQEPLDPEDPALISFAGTGPSARAVVLTHGNLTANAFQARLWVPDAQAGRERIVIAVPSALSQGLAVSLFAGVLSAAMLVLVHTAEPARVAEAIATTRATLLPGTPELFAAMIGGRGVGRRDLSSLRLATCAGPVAAGTAATFESVTQARLRVAFTVAEASSITHANPMYGRNLAGSIGLPVTDTVAAIVDDDGRPCRIGVRGRLAISGPQVAARYWGSPPAHGPSLRDGWVVTTNVAVSDGDGYFQVVDG